MSLAVMLRTRTKRISTRAAAHPAACSPGSADSEKAKIATGSVGSACDMSVEIWFAAIELVNSSGAVSPATRATEITTPGEDPSDRDGQDDVPGRAPLRHAEGEAALAQAAGITSSTSCVARATIGSIRIARANAP